MKHDRASQVAELAERYGRMVFAAAYRILGNAQDADDAFQRVFLRLLESRNGWTKPNRVRDWSAYLQVAASRSALELLRSQSKRRLRHRKLAQEMEASAAERSSRPLSPSQQAEMVREALAALSPRDARVVALRYFEDLSYEEIAAQMRLNVNQVGVILHRGRRRLREILQPRVGPCPGKQEITNRAEPGSRDESSHV